MQTFVKEAGDTLHSVSSCQHLPVYLIVVDVFKILLCMLLYMCVDSIMTYTICICNIMCIRLYIYFECWGRLLRLQFYHFLSNCTPRATINSADTNNKIDRSR